MKRKNKTNPPNGVIGNGITYILETDYYKPIIDKSGVVIGGIKKHIQKETKEERNKRLYKYYKNKQRSWIEAFWDCHNRKAEMLRTISALISAIINALVFLKVFGKLG